MPVSLEGYRRAKGGESKVEEQPQQPKATTTTTPEAGVATTQPEQPETSAAPSTATESEELPKVAKGRNPYKKTEDGKEYGYPDIELSALDIAKMLSTDNLVRENDGRYRYTQDKNKPEETTWWFDGQEVDRIAPRGTDPDDEYEKERWVDDENGGHAEKYKDRRVKGIEILSGKPRAEAEKLLAEEERIQSEGWVMQDRKDMWHGYQKRAADVMKYLGVSSSDWHGVVDKERDLLAAVLLEQDRRGETALRNMVDSSLKSVWAMKEQSFGSESFARSKAMQDLTEAYAILHTNDAGEGDAGDVAMRFGTGLASGFMRAGNEAKEL